MGLVISVILGLYLDKIFTSRLFRGQHSLKVTFWGFGVLGAIMALTLAGMYVGHVLKGDNSSGGGWTLMALRAVAAPIGVYAFVLFVGIWRSARNSSILVKVLVRYISIFYLSTAAGCAFFLAQFGLILAIAVFFLKRRWIQKRHRATQLLAAD